MARRDHAARAAAGSYLRHAIGAALLAPAILVADLPNRAHAADDFSQFAVTPNQKNIATALDEGSGNAAFDQLRLDLGALPPMEIGYGLVQLGNEIATVFPGMTLTDRRALLASFIDRLSPSCLEKGARYDADPTVLDPTVWARGFYRTGGISETKGATAGLETHPDKHSCAGIGLNYAKTDLALDGLPQSGEVEAYSFGAYVRRDGRLLFVDGAVAATYATIDSTRHILFAGKTAKGTTDSTGAGLIMGVGLVLRAGAFTLQPRIGLEYDHNDQDGFTETGAGAANLRLAGEDRDALRTSLGARLHTAWDLGSDRSLMPEFSVGWAHNLLEPPVAIKEHFVAAQNASFVITGEDPPVDFFLLGLGLSYHPNASGEIFIRYDGGWAKDVQADAFSAGGKLRW